MSLSDPIGSTAADVLARNAQDIDRVVNGGATVTTRTGRQIMSIDQALLSLGTEPPVTFAAGISVTRSTQSVIYSGLIYHARPDAIPFTTTGTFNAAQWTLREITASDLSSPSAGKGSAMILFIRRVTGAISRWVEDKLSESTSVEDFGAVGYPESSNDSTAISLALASGAKKIILTKPAYRITQPITIPAKVKLIGCGGKDPTSNGAGTQIIKASTMTSTAVILGGDGAQLEDVAVIGETGNMGDGVQIAAGRCTITRISANKMGGNGLRIGSDVAVNCNLWQAADIITRQNGGHGVYVHAYDGGSGPDVNGGTMTGLDTAANGGDGLRSDKSWLNTFIGVVAQTNTGYGINLTSLSRWNTLIGGDQNEGNISGQINDAGLANVMLGTSYTGVTSTGATWPVRINRDAIFWNANIASLLTATNSSVTTPYPVVVENTGNSSNGRGIGIEFKVPNGSGTSRSGARIASEQETANTDYLVFRTNRSGTMSDSFKLTSQGPVFYALPGGTNTPSNNGDIAMQITNNTTISFRVRGSDGVVRSATLTLA